MCVGEKEEGLYFSRKVWFIISRNLKESQCFPTLITKFRIHLKARVPTYTHLPTDKTILCFFFKRSQRWSRKMCTVNKLVLEHICILCDVIKCFFFICGEGLMEGCSESDPVKAILFCLQGVGTTITVAQVCHDFSCSTFIVPFSFSLLLLLYSVTPLCVFTYTLEQWFSTFFSTGPHYGPSASLTGRTHVIYILCHQYKPTKFIILFIA